MILMIDNYDSFTYNVVQYLAELGADVKVYRNDEISISEMEALSPERIVISPGPCTPNEAGISVQAIKHFAGKLPILGICLGHQSIAQAFGGKIVRVKEVMHGKTSVIEHNNQGVFKGLSNDLTVCRYHSLVVAQASLPKELEITAWTHDSQGQLDAIMGLKHRFLPLEGVQFHPEAILTQSGLELLANFIRAY